MPEALTASLQGPAELSPSTTTPSQGFVTIDQKTIDTSQSTVIPAETTNTTNGDLCNRLRFPELGQDPNVIEDGQFQIREHDYGNFAPVARIMKTALPKNAKIARAAQECIQECVSEFISFITSEASDKCQQEKRKAVNGEDILFAMTSLGFENYSEVLKIYLARYREDLVARGEHQKPIGVGDPATSAGAYNPVGHDACSNPMNPSIEASNDFYGHPRAPEYQRPPEAGASTR